MRKVLASDYDNTFYLNDTDIELNKEAVKQFRELGNIFVIATGRSYADLKKKVNQYNLEYDYAIIDHGAAIIDAHDNVIFSQYLDDSIIEEIKKDLCLEKSIGNFCCSLFESRVDFNHKNLTKINVKYENREDAWEINELINKKYGGYVNSYFLSSNSIEIISNLTNKSHAISILAKYLDIDKKQIYTVGDGYSDIEMVREFSGYAMEISVDKLKEVACGIVSSVSKLIDNIIKSI